MFDIVVHLIEEAGTGFAEHIKLIFLKNIPVKKNKKPPGLKTACTQTS